MKYQLVVQLGDSCEGSVREDMLTEELGDDLGYVDGHDWGSGTTNIFIHTDDPESAFVSLRS